MALHGNPSQEPEFQLLYSQETLVHQTIMVVVGAKNKLFINLRKIGPRAEHEHESEEEFQ